MNIDAPAAVICAFNISSYNICIVYLTTIINAFIIIISLMMKEQSSVFKFIWVAGNFIPPPQLDESEEEDNITR